MSYAIVTVVYGVPLNEPVARKLDEWEASDDARWFEDDDTTSGFVTLYSAGGATPGFCGVELCRLPSYEPCTVRSLTLFPTEEQKREAQAKVERLDPELRELAGPIDTYFIWSDS